ncbi:hypothetical protein K1719_045724 [Acacia pycnantha]|nr:hypothetical protein K1719_045724 [Acacia pycnantha]
MVFSLFSFSYVWEKIRDIQLTWDLTVLDLIPGVPLLLYIRFPISMAMVKMDNYFIKDRSEDVSWLCSLSEAEIDMLVNLKLCIIHRAEMIGHEELVKKFNLKVLRAIAFVSMEHLKEKVKNSSLTLDAVNLAALLDTCNLLRCDHEGIASVEDLSENIGIDPRTFLTKGPRDKVGSTLAKVKRRRKGFSVKKKTLKLKAKNKRFSRRI